MIAYASRTGNIRYIVSRLQLPAVEIKETSEIAEPFLLFTYTDGFGEVPPQVKQFMEKNGTRCEGVIVSGNRNFGHHNFGRAGETIAAQWRVPLVRKLELRGFPEDYEAIHLYYEQCFRKERTG
jgi:protein involved in ribonucleotide reduction